MYYIFIIYILLYIVRVNRYWLLMKDYGCKGSIFLVEILFFFDVSSCFMVGLVNICMGFFIKDFRFNVFLLFIKKRKWIKMRLYYICLYSFSFFIV